MYIVIKNYADDGSEIDPSVYSIDTDEQTADARDALRERGETSADIWAGDPESGDAYKTGHKLHA